MKTVVILGNARSGTSMTAGILNHLGVAISHVHQPNSQNPKGAFESMAFNTITSKMHQELNQGKPKKYILATYGDKIKELVEKHQSELWGWKSAATHWTLDLFLPYLQNPHLVIVTRNIMHNAESWKVHMKTNYGQNVTFDQAMDNMIDSTKVLISEVKKAKCPKCWTTYEDIRANPLAEAEKMAKFLGIEFGKAKKEKVAEFIMPEYSTLKK